MVDEIYPCVITHHVSTGQQSEQGKTNSYPKSFRSSRKDKTSNDKGALQWIRLYKEAYQLKGVLAGFSIGSWLHRYGKYASIPRYRIIISGWCIDVDLAGIYSISFAGPSGFLQGRSGFEKVLYSALSRLSCSALSLFVRMTINTSRAKSRPILLTKHLL